MTELERIRAEIEAGKAQAMRNFKRNWGTDDVKSVVGALRQTIPGSASPADAARKARKMLPR